MFARTGTDNAGQTRSAATATPAVVMRHSGSTTAHMLLVTLIVLLLGSCAAIETQSQLSNQEGAAFAAEGGSAAGGQPGGSAQGEFASGTLAALPSLAELLRLEAGGSAGGDPATWRAASVVLDKTLAGDEALLMSELVELDPEAHLAVMHTGFDGFSYAIYRFCLLYTSPSPRD